MMETEKFTDNMDTIKRLIGNLVDDPEREGLLDTPRRVAKFWQYMTAGYQMDIDKVAGDAIYRVEHDDMVIVRDVEIYSLCEHHLLPFFGKCHVGYVPDGRIIGLSKIPRIIDIFSRRLQVQEKLGDEISKAIIDIVKPKGVGVIIEAHHLCMKMARGAKTTLIYPYQFNAWLFQKRLEHQKRVHLLRAQRTNPRLLLLPCYVNLMGIARLELARRLRSKGF